MATEREDVELSISAIIDGASIDDLTKVLTSGVEKATTQGGKRAGKQYAEHIAAAVDEGVRSASDSKTVKDFAKKVLRAEEMQKQIVAAYEKGDKEHGKFLERERKKEIAHLKKVADRRKQHFAEYSRLQSRTFTETADDFNDKLSSGIGNLFSGNIDVGGMLKGAGKKMQQKGDAAVQRGKMADASKTQRMMGGVGKAMAGVGAGMMAFGAVAAILIVLVKAFIDIHDKVAEMNQSFAATAGAADFGLGTAAVRAGEFTAKLDSVRESVLAFSSKLGPDAWFVSSKDLFAILGGMNEMNYRFEEMEKNIENNVHGLSSFSDHAVMAVAYGKLLGVTGLEMGQNMAKMANEFGVGLNVIAEGLSMVHQEAMLSGFSTKRFYSTILEVTSGLGAYNVRLTEASSLLTMMGAALGQAEGSKAFKALAGEGFQNMDPVEALKAILLRGGPEKVQDIFADEAKAKAEQLFVAMDETQRKAFGEKFNLDTSSAEAFGESFAKAAPAQKAVRDELANMKYAGIKPEAKTAAYEGAGLAKAGKGKGDVDRMAANIGSLGAASRMRFMMRLPEMLGFDSMAEAFEEGNIPELKAALDTIGISMEEFRRSSQLVGRLESEFKELKKEGKKVGVGERIDRGQYGTFQKVGEGKFQRVIKDALGNWTPQGGVFKDVDSYVGAMNNYIEQDTKVIDAELEAAQKMSRETEKVANALEDNIAKILNDIYIVVRDILNWLMGSDKKRAQQTAAGKTLISELAGDEKKAKAALATAKAAHETALNTPGANTKATGAAVESASADVDKYTKLREAATELDPGAFASYADYKTAVYKKAGVDITGGKGPPPGGEKKGAATQRKVEQDFKGKSAGEASAEGWEGVASWLAGGESGITSWREFESYMNEFWPNSGIPKSDQQAFMDYWKQSYLLRMRNDPRAQYYASRPDSQFLGGQTPGGIGLASEHWMAMREEGEMLSDVEKLTRGGEGRDLMFKNYREQLAFMDSSGKYQQEEESKPNYGGGGSTVPEAKGHYEKGKWVYDDVFIPSNGQPIALNSKDDVLAMKPGGAVDKAMGGRGGSGSPVTINVRGGNPREVMDAVIKGINIANGKPFA